jgi:hypothetical protein
MNQIDRRSFLKSMVLTALGAPPRLASVPPPSPLRGQPQTAHILQGHDLSGWETLVGDGIYAAPGVSPVVQADIETDHAGTFSELRANTRQRRIMAHNITLNTIVTDTALSVIHHCSYDFRLPYLPQTTNTEMNAQTLEGGISIWDGQTTRRRYSIFYQWILNPYWERFREVSTWTGRAGGSWQTVGTLAVDTEWHHVSMTLDVQQQTTAVRIDGVPYPSSLAVTRAPETWGSEVAASLTTEIISIYPGETASGALHRAHFRDWTWKWEPYNSCRVFLPMVVQ